MFDELAQQYLGSAGEFAAAVKLLQKCKTAEQNAASFEELETTFLDNLDDVTGRDMWLLHQAFDYENARRLGKAESPAAMTAFKEEILPAVQSQATAHIKPISLDVAYDKFISDKRSGLKDGNQETHYRQDISPPLLSYQLGQFAISPLINYFAIAMLSFTSVYRCFLHPSVKVAFATRETKSKFLHKKFNFV